MGLLIHKWLGTWLIGWFDGLVSGWMDGLIDWYMDEWTGWWLDERMDCCVGGLVDGYIFLLSD
jgi:hypothetical protein